MIFLCHHLYEDLKNEYLMVKDSYVLWKSLQERYEQQETVNLSKARHYWIHLRLQDFKIITAYNSTVFRITS